MMKESQRQDRVRRPAFVPDEDGEQNDSRADERGLRQPDFSFAEIDKRSHQRAAAGAGEQRAGKVEPAVTPPDTLAHSDDDEESRHHGDRHINEKSPPP